MPLNQAAKNEFVQKMVRDLTKKNPNPTAEIRAGIEEYAADLHDRIVELIKSSTVWNSNDGSDTSFRIR